MADLSLIVRGLIRDWCIDEHPEYIIQFLENDDTSFLKEPQNVVGFGKWLRKKHGEIFDGELINLENLERVNCVGEG